VIGLDTNVLVRVGVDAPNDDPEQARQARARLASLSVADPGYVTHVVLVETWWVLRRRYDRPANAVVGFLGQLCETSAIIVQDRDLVLVALDAVREQGADFADALIVAISSAAGAPRVETFDRKAIARAGMQPIRVV
jgi:predicted nucleic-acid-binding protein